MAGDIDLGKLLQPVFGRNGIGLARIGQDPEDGTVTYGLRGPWREGQVRLHTLGTAEDPDLRLEVEIEVPVADDEDAPHALPAIIDPDTVVRVAAITCQTAFETFFEAHPAAEEMLDPDASGVYARQVGIAGITETMAIELLVGCDVLGDDRETAVPQAAELLCDTLSALRAETPFLEGAPNRADRRRRGPKTHRR